MYGKSIMEACITIAKIDNQWEFSVWLRKLKQELCINLERWDAEGNGRGVQNGGDICIPMADSCWGLRESNKILYSNDPSVKNKLIKNKRNNGINPWRRYKNCKCIFTQYGCSSIYEEMLIAIIKGDIDSNKRMVEGIKTPLTTMDR